VGRAAGVAVVGAGPVGLTLALELQRYDVPVVVLEAKPKWEHEGSKAMVLARHTFDTLRRLGCAQPAEKAVILDRARTYYRGVELFCVEFPRPRSGETPLFGNLQQSYVEQALLARAGDLVRWDAPVEELTQDGHGVTLRLAGGEEIRTAYAVGCDGPRSTVRKLLGIGFPGRTFDDRFLIADVRAELPFPNERRFHFDPPWNPGRQLLIHPQPDSQWRMDWQVPAATDVEDERRGGRIHTRIRQIVGDAPYELAWLSSYRFHERIADRFRAGRILLAGDAAHLMAPFGARGLNSGVEDARNLGWRLAAVLADEAPEALLDGYAHERRAAARENIRVTSATMRFMVPPTRAHRLWRNLVLRGSLRSRRWRARVNSGRLAVPATYDGEAPVGRPCPVRVREERLGFGVATLDGADYLVRPDGYVCARLEGGVEEAIAAALLR